MLAAAALLPALPGHPGVPCPLRLLHGNPGPVCGMAASVGAPVPPDLRHGFAPNPAGNPPGAGAPLLFDPRPGFLRVALAFPRPGLALQWGFELHRFGFV